MKKVILIIVVLIVVLSCGIIEQVFVQSTLDNLISMTNTLESYVDLEDKENALIYVNSIKTWWYDKRDYLEFVCPNNDIKDLIREIGEVEGSIKSENFEDAKTYTNVLREMAKNSKNLLAYNWKNVF